MSGELILIVDDNDKNLKLVRDILQYHGFRTLEATTGRQGIDLARETDPDVVLLDIQLPDIDGVRALQELRASAMAAATPVVALTAFAMKSDRQRFLDEGFSGYIAKPIDVRTFPLLVREFCEARGQ
ncbi:MAG TPA: response regulator [Dehalococcoidia bacterium]